MQHFLGVEGGGTNTHALIANQDGQILGFGAAGPGNWEGVGLEGMTQALQSAVGQALHSSGLKAEQIHSAGMGLYIGKYELDESCILPVFEIAAQGDPAALGVMRRAGAELGDMACGVIRQLGLEAEVVEVVFIGSLWKGHPLLIQSARRVIRQVATISPKIATEIQNKNKIRSQRCHN